MDHRERRTLYRLGALAPLIALTLYVVEFSILFLGDPYPTSVEGWFALMQRSKLLGLWYLNALDIVSWALLGILFLALYVALRPQRPAWMVIALYFALLGVVVFVVPRSLTLSLLPLSDLHAAAPGEAQRAIYLAAGEALAQVATATPQTLGFLFMAVSGLIISVVILPGGTFARSALLGKAASGVGIAGFGVTLANYLSALLAPGLAALLMPINGLLWFAWWLMMSAGLWRLASHAAEPQGAEE